MRVLVVDPVSASGQALAQLFRYGDAVADHTDRGVEAVELARSCSYDAILADHDLPDMSGSDLVRRLRAARIDTPVLLQADQERPQVRIQAFGAGADDVVAKPCDPGELLARVRALVRRDRGSSRPVLQCGPVQLRLDSKEAWVSGQPLQLTGKEYAILELLVMRKGMVLTKEVFLNHLYGGMDEPEAKIIDVFICKLRRKLSQAGAPDVIGTVWGRGYTVCEIGSRHVLSGVTPHPAPEMALRAGDQPPRGGPVEILVHGGSGRG